MCEGGGQPQAYQLREHYPAFHCVIDTFQPSRWYWRWRPLTEKAGGFDINRDVKKGHGPLGERYTIQKEGDTPSFMHCLPKGLVQIDQPFFGSWAGRFGYEKKPLKYMANQKDAWSGSSSRDNTLKRWAVHIQNDFAARADWCVKGYSQANHPPVPVVNGNKTLDIIHVKSPPNKVIALSAAGSADPDGDKMQHEWIYYPEPGTYNGKVSLSSLTGERTSFTTPSDFTEGHSIHIVLAVTDNGTPALTRYRRIVVHGQESHSQRPPVRTEPAEGTLALRNGWYVQNNRIIWGNAQHNGWWGAYRTNITRNAPGLIGPNRTEDLDKLTDAMIRYGYPALEHNYGLWYDRRRDRHDTGQRGDSKAVGPYLEQPWARSGRGTAWDGLSHYDLTRYNEWYFARLKAFADLCDRKGTILLHNFYMQHALLETTAHYVDFPWRPVNCIQETGMPLKTPAANVFYDVTHPVRRKLHQAYIRKCLDVLGRNSNVVFLCSQEYTGPVSFMNFWLDTTHQWEKENGVTVHVAVSGCRNVMDSVLNNPVYGSRIQSLDLRYWYYKPDGRLFAPEGGRETAGRYAMGKETARTTPEQIYRQVREYRTKYPRKGIIHMVNASREQTWATLMGGGSLLVRYLQSENEKETKYLAPAGSDRIMPLYHFIREHCATSLAGTKPCSLVNNPKSNWCLANPGYTYLVYALKGGTIALDLSDARETFTAKWLDPRTGELSKAGNGQVKGGQVVQFNAPGREDWALWLSRTDKS